MRKTICIILVVICVAVAYLYFLAYEYVEGAYESDRLHFCLQKIEHLLQAGKKDDVIKALGQYREDSLNSHYNAAFALHKNLETASDRK